MENHRHYTLDVFESDESGFVGAIREMPGVVTQADSIEALKENAIDAIETMLAYHRENNRYDSFIGYTPNKVESIAVC